MIEIDRETVSALVRDRVCQMIEAECPDSTKTNAGRQVLDDLERSPGFQAVVTQQVTELKARMNGWAH